MVEQSNLADIIPRLHRIAGITTNSLRSILDLLLMDDRAFPFGITKLVSWASIDGKIKSIYEDENYGIKVEETEKVSYFSLNYLLDWDDDGNAKNPIDILGRRKILRALDMSGCEDASVRLLKVLILDPKIGEYSNTNEELFHATLNSDPVDNEKDRAKVREHPVNEALIKYNNFQYRILHCRELIDRRQELTQPKSRHKPIVYWRGDTAISMRSPIKVAQQIKSHFGEYGLIKQYGVSEELKLVLLSVAR